MRPFDERMKTLLMILNRDPSIIGFLVGSYYIDTYRPILLRERARARLVAVILAVIAMHRLSDPIYERNFDLNHSDSE